MKNAFAYAALCLLCGVITFTACGEGSGSSGGGGTNDSPGSLFVSRSVLAAGEGGCLNGGVAINMGFDNNKNNILDTDEITNTENVCNGLNGADGTNGTDGTDGSDSTSHPFIVYASPQYNDPAVTPKAVISVVFNTAMDAASITASTFTVKDENNTAIAGTVAYSNTVATFTPTYSWYGDPLRGSKYTVTLASTIQNSLSVPMGYDHQISFIIDKTKYWASVPGGTFTQSDGTSSFSHTITGFKMARYEVTYELWYTVYKWAITNGYTFESAGREGSDGVDGAAPTVKKNKTVMNITWGDAIVWCNAYSEMSGLNPCYTSSSSVIKDSRNTNSTALSATVCSWTETGYRLPTEGEWQYAASYIDGANWTPSNYVSGAPSATSFYNYAWCSLNIPAGGSYFTGWRLPNALDIYDMGGNAFEWCWDRSGAYPGTSTDYRGAGGTDRVKRGGAYILSEQLMQVGYRSYMLSVSKNTNTGFRLALIQ